MKKRSSKKSTIESLEDSYLSVIVGEEIIGDQQKTASGNTTALDSDSSAPAADGDKPRIIVDVTDNGMTVWLRISRGDTPVGPEQIEQELQKQNIVHGIDHQVIKKVVALLQENEAWEGELVIGHGQRPGKRTTLRSSFFEILEDQSSDGFIFTVQGKRLNDRDLPDFFSSLSIDFLEKKEIQVLAVKPNEVIAVLEKNADAPVGMNVYGLETAAKSFRLGAGENVSFHESDGRYTANCFGYVYCADNALHVLPPVWITPDAMAAYFVNLPQFVRTLLPTPQQLHALLMLAGIRDVFFDIARLEEVCRYYSQSDTPYRMLKIAKGIQPVFGTDAEFTLVIDDDVKAGTLRQDNSIDLRERNVVKSVMEGTYLGKKTLATKGMAGMTLFGKKIPVTNGIDISIAVNDGVKQAKQGNEILYFAKRTGNLSFRKGTLAVTKIFSINGDVDYSTGNIDLQTDLTIKGSVLPGFKVKAAGDTIINGNIEDGATIFVQGNLDVGQGIFGTNTKVIVFGDLRTAFIQDAEVIVKGDVTIRTYLFNARLRSGGLVRILREQESSRGGSAVGGIVCASKGIELSVIGSPTNQSTCVVIQPNPELQAETRKVEQEIAQISLSISKMLRTLQLDRPDPALIRSLLDLISPDKKKLYVNVLQNMSKMIKYQNELKEKKKALQLQEDYGLHSAAIRITSEFFQGNEIQIGDKKFKAPGDMGPKIFKLEDNQLVY